MTRVNRDRQRLTFVLMLAILICPFALRYMGVGQFLTSTIGLVLICSFLMLSTLINFKMVINNKDLVLFIGAISLLLLSLLKNKSFGVVITFLNLCMFLIVLNNVSFSLKQVQFMRVFAIVLLYLMISEFKIRWKNGVMWIYDGYDKINLNTYGVILLVLYFNVVSLIDLSIKKKIVKYILFAISTAVAVYYISQTDCRSALLSAFFLIGLVIFEKANYKKILFLLVIAGFIVPVIYISLYEVLGNVQFLGKSLYSGRQAVWLNTWEIIKTAPILGSGTSERIYIAIGELTDSAHNIYLAFWKTIGLAPMLLFVWCLLNGKNINSIFSYNSWTKKTFLACMVVSLVETLLNDPNYNFLFMLLLMNVDDDFSYRRRLF